MAKMKTNDPKSGTVDWLKLLDVGIDAGSKHAVTVVNFLLKQLVTRTAERLDVGASRIRLDFGRVNDGFLWTAKLIDRVRQDVAGEPTDDPMEAVANLVEEIECSDD